jgi:hypothetical protein
MASTKVFRKPGFFIMCSALLIVMSFCLTYAAEVNYPVAAYTANELAKVREWEKTWVGKKIDKTNIDQVAEFMPPSYVDIYKNPETWGGPPEGFYFYIVPYQQVIETPGMIEATKKYAPLVKKNADGSIANYAEIAGVPFPNSKDGQELAWNFDLANHGDMSHYARNSPSINPRTKSDRYGEQDQWEYFFIHRTEVDPLPAVANNAKGYHRGVFIHMWGPPEFINTRYYSLRFIDPAKDDEMYLWYSQFRRIRRMSTSQRTDSVDGTDLIYDDEFFWDGHISRNNYTYKGNKELLCTRHQDMSKVVRQQGQGLVNNLTYERCKTLAIDVVSKDKNYVYGKRVWYLDPETHIILWTEIYDLQGRFWKCFLMHTNNVKTAKGVMKNFIVGYHLEDLQRIHSGFNIHEIKSISSSADVDPDMFKVGYLQKTY